MKITDPDPKFISELSSKKTLELLPQLKRITDVLLSQTQELYNRHGKKIKSSWLSFLVTIKTHPNSDVKDLAQLRNVSSSAVSQVLKELSANELVEISTSKESRSKLIRTTAKGEELLLSISPELKMIEAALAEALGNRIDNFINDLNVLEASIKQKPIYKRIQSSIELETFCVARAADFRRLNLEWLEKEFRVENYDRKLLDEPKTNIIDNGGEIFFLVDASQAVATLALIKHNSATLELSKMAVTDAYKGWGLANLLMDSALEYARKNNYKELVIYTSSKLKTALKLYEAYGFESIPVPEEEKQRYGLRADLGFKLAL
jgi:DNA-binding MarR family transcriptional regulator/GNAT superfamily N-acetyltransferase